MLYFMLGAGVLALSAAFRLAAVFRLTIPLLYALIVPTLFHDWFYSHQALAEGIWYVFAQRLICRNTLCRHPGMQGFRDGCCQAFCPFHLCFLLFRIATQV